MKLNPPASSSDLEAAREIARRLHQRRRRADFERVGDQRGAPAPAEPPARPASALFAPAAPLGRPRPTEPPAPAFERRTSTSRATPHLPPPPPAPEPAPPSWDDDESEAEPHEHLTGALGDLDETGEPAEAAEAAAIVEPTDAEASSDAALSGLPGVEVEEPGVEIEEEETISPDEMVGAGEDEPATGDDPFREPLGTDELEPTLPAPDEGALGDAAEEIFDETPAPPSWDDVVETCRDLAGASGAMIIDPAGQVFAARGAWPDPGPDAIAGRLVVMMERTLKDAPTRSVSAPVGGQHLTAWRVPIDEGLLTAAFIADAPLRSDVRTAIDAEIHRGAGA